MKKLFLILWFFSLVGCADVDLPEDADEIGSIEQAATIAKPARLHPELNPGAGWHTAVSELAFSSGGGMAPGSVSWYNATGLWRVETNTTYNSCFAPSGTTVGCFTVGGSFVTVKCPNFVSVWNTWPAGYGQQLASSPHQPISMWMNSQYRFSQSYTTGAAQGIDLISVVPSGVQVQCKYVAPWVSIVAQ